MPVKIITRQFRLHVESLLNPDSSWPRSQVYWSELVADDAIWRRADSDPVKLAFPWLPRSDQNFWLYKDTQFKVTGCAGLREDEIGLLIRDTLDSERRKIERLRGRYDGKTFRRERISDAVRIFVWQRDGGACAKCGKNQNLEFDHIIPVSQGGSSTARNVQLLCEICNRVKSDQIGA
jgi:hypothetical protein